MDIINNAVNYLNDGGEFYFVMNKDHGAKNVIEKIQDIVNEYNKKIEEITKEKEKELMEI